MILPTASHASPRNRAYVKSQQLRKRYGLTMALLDGTALRRERWVEAETLVPRQSHDVLSASARHKSR